MADDTAKPGEEAKPETASREDLGLTKDDGVATHDADGKKAEEEGEPFDGNFA